MQSLDIYTLANDVVFDQLVLLLNSIKVNISAGIPVCVIPYDHRLERVKMKFRLLPMIFFEAIILLYGFQSIVQPVSESTFQSIYDFIQ